MKDVEDRIKQQGEHGPPPIVAKALAAIAKTTRAELRRLEAAIAAKIKANPGFARRAEIVTSVPGLAGQTAAGVIAWLPELGRIRNEAAAALIGAAPYDDDSGGRKGHIKGGRRRLRNLLFVLVMRRRHPAQPGAQGLLPAPDAPGARKPGGALSAGTRKLIVIRGAMLAARLRPGTRRLEPPHRARLRVAAGRAHRRRPHACPK